MTPLHYMRRLSSGASQGRIVSYEYDLGGNLTHIQDSMNSRGTTFQYAPDNRLLALEDYPVEMDADGNLLYKSNGESMASYEYDARNRLVRSGKARYTYNMLGTRTSMSWRGKTTQYVVDDLGELSRVLMELDEAGTPTAFYVYGLGLIGREDANGNYVCYHSDIRGSTTLLTDEQGSVTDRYTYGIYGELEQHEGSTHQPFQYNGRDGVMTDPNGLYYMRARYYDPQLKRFLNRDVILGDLTDGQTLNRFAYVNGDPVGYVDPLGLFKCDVVGNPPREYAKPSLWERLTTKKLSTDKLVANPLDEFSMPHIGPSDRAISKHMKYIAENGKIDVTDGPIVVKKLLDGTYEIQNGHHRWEAAKRLGLKNVPVKLKKINY
ncbi:ParB N-terminal domain-containing protein [Paenibacillus sp. Marseille-P2973]|nr:ParB N-terminal domain-containing protein [Paenibacillus sp. Marseille-P2973]